MIAQHSHGWFDIQRGKQLLGDLHGLTVIQGVVKSRRLSALEHELFNHQVVPMEYVSAPGTW